MSQVKESTEKARDYIAEAIVRDNRVIYNQEVRRRNYGITCFVGNPDSKKSDKLGEMLMSHYLASSSDNPPIITLMHKNCESAEFINTIIDELPDDKKGMAVNRVIYNTAESAINPFDTHVGFKAPTSMQRLGMSYFLLHVLTQRGEKVDYDLLGKAAEHLIDRAFESTEGEKGLVIDKPYRKGCYQELDEVVLALGLAQDGQISAAKLSRTLHSKGINSTLDERERLWLARDQAHKLAVPTLPDILTVFNACKNTKDFVSSLKGQESALLPQIEQQLKIAIDEYPCFSHPTKLDIRDSFIVGIDLSAVIKDNDAWNDALFFQVAHSIGLSRVGLLHSDLIVEELSDDFKPYYKEKLQQLADSSKAFAIDGLDIQNHTNIILISSREQKKHGVRYILSVESLIELMAENYGIPVLGYVTRFNIFSRMSDAELDIFMRMVVYENAITRNDFKNIDDKRYIFYARPNAYDGDDLIGTMLSYKQCMSADCRSNLRRDLRLA